ncbi:hypothetical protein COB21_01465 [Candidatus Aerophobetes bacterium]|uniref:OmpH family outer membrane protein n=1 Tax=Aerophobetes bacterium TaxID=2030807 RepID=A0A2A4X6N9_UNCAE|nr:MAG: hypothetical protein COB21_01465 [Candidatus Aerophobetes bacterium]
MNWKKTLTVACTLVLCSAAAHADALKVGIVNFEKCITESKFGKKEQENFDAVKTQMNAVMGDLQSQIQTMADDFNNPELMDSLSHEAEEEMKGKYQSLNEEYQRAQNQFMQVMNQAQMQVLHSMGSRVAEASKKLAEDSKNLPESQQISLVVRDDICFYYNAPQDEVTNDVVAILDKQFDLDQKSNAAEKTSESTTVENTSK